MSLKLLRSLAALSATMATVALGACDDWMTKPDLGHNTVQVTTTRRNGDPVPNVNVVLYTGQRPMGYGTTGADGRYTFSDVPKGLYGVIASIPDGYEILEDLVGGRPSTIHDDLHIQNDTTLPLQFTFLKKGPGTVVARVVSTDGAPLTGTPVELYSPTATVAHVLVDQNGLATFKDVPFGVYGLVVIRPLYYRDYKAFNDSLYTYRDNLVVEEGTRDSLAIPLTRCMGTVRVTTVDENNNPVPATTVAFFSSTQTLGVAATASDGRVSFTNGPCATQLGVNLNPAPGYTFTAVGRGSSFQDGIVLSNTQVVDVTFRLKKAP